MNVESTPHDRPNPESLSNERIEVDETVESTDTLTAGRASPVQEEIQSVTLDDSLAFVSDILDKQYRNYAWNDVKMQALITANSVIFAVIGFLFSTALPDIAALLLLLLGVTLISISLLHCLLHAVPKLQSKQSGPDNNPRSISGITSAHREWQDYLSQVRSLSKDEMFVHTVRQVYGMASNNRDSHRTLRIGVCCTFVAVCVIILSMVAASLAAREIHLLGRWSVPVAASQDSELSVQSETSESSAEGSVTSEPSKETVVDRSGGKPSDEIGQEVNSRDVGNPL